MAPSGTVRLRSPTATWLPNVLVTWSISTAFIRPPSATLRHLSIRPPGPGIARAARIEVEFTRNRRGWPPAPSAGEGAGGGRQELPHAASPHIAKGWGAKPHAALGLLPPGGGRAGGPPVALTT